MKIVSRIAAEQGGQQLPVGYWTANAKVLFLRRGRSDGLRSPDPERLSGQRPSPPPASSQVAFLTEKLLEIQAFFAKWAPTSTRHWVKSRCYRKQSIKPRLTDTRTAIRELAKS
jgi:hypothetical protein